jgi:DNA repair exonuclease SbcCD ATPase subunit
MVQTNGKKLDHLTEDDPIVGQQFVCLSFLSPEGIRNCTTRGLKVRGVFSTYEEAQERCKELQSKDKDFDIFIGEVGKWLPWDPDINDDTKIRDRHYQEEELQKLMDGYKKNAIQKEKVELARQKDMKERAANNEQSRKKKRVDRMKKKLEQSNAQKDKTDTSVQDLDLDDLEVDTTTTTNRVGGKKPKEYALTAEEEAIIQKEKEIDKQEQMATAERERLSKDKQKLAAQQTTVSTIDQQLSKIQALYDKLNNKKTAAAEKVVEKSG